MAHTSTKTGTRGFKLSFEFFPPKSEEMEHQLWATVDDLAGWDPEFVSVTYGAGGTTKAPTLAAVRRLIGETGLATASHLTCVGATREEVAQVVEDFRAVGVKHFVALRGDPPTGVGSAYQPHPGGYENAAALVEGLKTLGDFEISVSAYPEKHPESADLSMDIDMLKRKVDNGATRALTQFFFDNDHYSRYLDRVHAAGITIPIVPGIMPILNLNQLKRFASMCGTSIPASLDKRFEGMDDKPAERATVAAALAAEQIADLQARGVDEFHLYTMNRAPLVNATLEQLGLQRSDATVRNRAGALA
ncbi:methylenetetrahydrofolate reductase [NAD(P)H] [Allorhizobium taibaishanense]|uniref:Methylenetetrahydrofolate reductase n=1 Tax=Allorhizobium taibaishanense TaxID=887144 RepID=A0A1Q9A3J8_9HYPH|nr:methylenetetrahydrofolate reductase [NAD(P)H] [Allorhizobium taibaishanense]MBB4006182.1 methylenetetrahydrofolate reductase (NADPH) [Allorhizobium taibaishanense]OLP49174.1 methylenetetrahydrofolate reductase [NAD(P)H] [Allorhizobium taibaishanense]